MGIKRCSTLLDVQLFSPAVNWDESLARSADLWASRCQYEYPPMETYNYNSNIYWMRNQVLVTDTDMVSSFLDKAVNRWATGEDTYRYFTHCNPSCHYAKMVQADTDKIGCSIQTCDNRRNPNYPPAFTMLVCFYNPSQDVRGDAPYTEARRGYSCSRCPARTRCQGNLCVNIDKRERARVPVVTESVSDELTLAEERILFWNNTNSRRYAGLTDLVWDDGYLKKWVKYIINCDVNYPGPRGTYTNFHRLQQGENVADVVSSWLKERGLSNLRFTHGCRSKNDETECTHFSNMMSPSINSISCAAKRCSDRRHIVCLYDDDSERDYWSNVRSRYATARPRDVQTPEEFRRQRATPTSRVRYLTQRPRVRTRPYVFA
ncbi:Cysteine-rich secretory protein LCCL domain-containing 2 [Bulinus truncatus]|nr:Cysteine-rich secretory protein LCCL domain-containing 2 [Bulinus truncatus]